jgi:hypothetical protein
LSCLVLDEHAGVEQVLVHQACPDALSDLEGHPASGYPLGLVPHDLHGLTTDRDFETAQPSVECLPKFDLSFLGPEGLRL